MTHYVSGVSLALKTHEPTRGKNVLLAGFRTGAHDSRLDILILRSRLVIGTLLSPSNLSLVTEKKSDIFRLTAILTTLKAHNGTPAAQPNGVDLL